MAPSESFRYRDVSGLTVSENIVNAVCEFTGLPMRSLPPLYEYIDSDALDELVSSLDESAGPVKFIYDGYRVRVEGDGTVAVVELDE